MKNMKAKIKILGIPVSIETDETEEDYISLTDMIKGKDGDFFISDWLRNRNTLEFIGVWEQMYNPAFNYGEFAIIKSQAGLNSFKISTKNLIDKTNIIGLRAKAGRYGGTFAHKDIAFEFGMWISPEFKLLLIKEYQRLKNDENSRLSLSWNVKREIAKVNYKIHTDAIKENLIPPTLTSKQIQITYANEADIINMALFGMTAKQWREKNHQVKGNIRDTATIEQLIVLSNLETINSLLIKNKISQEKRLWQLNNIAMSQINSLLSKNLKSIKSLKKLDT